MRAAPYSEENLKADAAARRQFNLPARVGIHQIQSKRQQKYNIS
jgi:hypothetical protein